VAGLKPIGVALPQRMQKLARAVESAQPRVLKDGAFAATKIHRKIIKDDVGGESRMSGVGKRGQKVGARFDISGDKAAISATGPLHLIERRTKPHRIPRQRKTSRAKKRYAVIPGVGVRAYAKHPGTRAQHTWTRAAPKAQKAATDAIREEYWRWIKEGFKA